MTRWICGFGVSFALMGLLAYRSDGNETQTPFPTTLQFNTYTFQLAIPVQGSPADLTVRAWRGTLLLTNFTLHAEGDVIRAEVADLDNNRFPEVYIYTSSNGTGSFGRVYGWQFFADHRATIIVSNWRQPIAEGYMGHDSLWVESSILCRRFPIYRAGDANALPTGGWQMIRYQLRPVKQEFQLVAL